MYIEKEQTTQWPKEKVQKDKQRSTKHTHKTKDRVTRTTLKTRGEVWLSYLCPKDCYTRFVGRIFIYILFLINSVLLLCCFVYPICKKSLKIPKGGNQNSYIEEEQTTQCLKEKVQKDKLKIE